LILPEFMRAAMSLAIARAARDAHRTACEYDAQDCPTCNELATMVRRAKEALRVAPAE
jgi:hypothetical protein